MVVSRDYMVRKPSGPSAPKRFLDTRIVPRLVNAAGSGEVLLDRAARRTGVRPSLILAGIGAGVALLTTNAMRRQDQPAE